MIVAFLPLIVALLLVSLASLTPVSRRIDLAFRRLSLMLFGTYIENTHPSKEARRKKRLRAAHMGTTHRVYAGKSLLYSAIAGIGGGIFGVYGAAALVMGLGVTEEAIRAALPRQLEFAAGLAGLTTITAADLILPLVVSTATVGVVLAVATYWLRWYIPEYRASNRRRQIDKSLVGTIAFVYALSRGGMNFTEIMRTVAQYRNVYGAAAEELGIAVRDMEWQGHDLITAVNRMARQTPNENFKDFGENLANVLESGQTLSTFLKDQYDRYLEEEEAQQEQFLELLATIAEGYISLFVVGPLMLVVILVVVGVMGLGDTQSLLQASVYLIVPLANVGFMVYVDTLTESFAISDEDHDIQQDRSAFTGGIRRAENMAADGGTDYMDAATRANIERLRVYNRLRDVLHNVSQPARTLIENPLSLLYVTGPFVAIVTIVRLWLLFDAGNISPGTLDDVLMQSALFLAGTFAVVQELHKRRVDRIEAAIPDFLDRLASVNEAGMAIVESIRRVSRNTDLGELDDEVDRIKRDIEWGADAQTALYRFERRLRSPAITRVVTLLTNAMAATGNLGPVLRVAADDAQATQRQKRARRREMVTYTLIIYLAFFVFLVVVAAFTEILLPALPSGDVLAGAQVGGVSGVGIGGISFDKHTNYTLLFAHMAMLQGMISGLVAGQMGEGDVRNGAKHAFVLGSIAYVAFLILL